MLGTHGSVTVPQPRGRLPSPTTVAGGVRIDAVWAQGEKPGILLTAATRGSEASALGNGDTAMSLVARMKHRKGMKVSQFEGRKKGFVWMY